MGENFEPVSGASSQNGPDSGLVVEEKESKVAQELFDRPASEKQERRKEESHVLDLFIFLLIVLGIIVLVAAGYYVFNLLS